MKQDLGKVLATKVSRERYRVETYGYIRPIISSISHGYRMVAVHGGIHSSQSWKTVPDFLYDLVSHVLGSDWIKSEVVKPAPERHPVVELHNAHRQFRQGHCGTKGPDGLFYGAPDGPATAYLQLAYDLYVVSDHGKLQERLVDRLRHPAEYQAARYELAVTAHCLRAGFDIAHEDEADPTSKHPEFFATHKKTGQVIAVEAKSRHRSGVLGFDGGGAGFPGHGAEPPRAGVRSSLKKALRKFEGNPFAVFVDLNLPPSQVGHDINQLSWLREVVDEVDDLPAPHPYNILIFTNFAEHYGAEGDARPNPEWAVFFSRHPQATVAHPEALAALYDAANQYGRIPNFFDDNTSS